MTYTSKNWKKTFYVIFTGQAFSMLTTSMVQFSIMWYLTDSRGSAVVLAISTLAGFVPQAVVGPFIGPLVDKINRKALMIGADMSIAFVSLILAGFFYAGDPGLPVIYLVLVLRSIGTAFHVPALQASIPMLAPKEELTRIAGWQQFVYSGANLAGPVLGIGILSVLSIEYVLLLDVLGAAIASASLLFVKIPMPEKTEEDSARKGLFKEMKYGLEALLENKGLFLMSIAVMFIMFVFFPAGSIYPILVKYHFLGGGEHLAAAEALCGLGMVAGSLALGKWGAAKYQTAFIAASTVVTGFVIFGMGALPADGFKWFLTPVSYTHLTLPTN
jgi:DHA3 family macrolide efflux protein-like MFS transporter